MTDIIDIQSRKHIANRTARSTRDGRYRRLHPEDDCRLESSAGKSSNGLGRG
jgi:hypothetical protein